MTAIRRRDERGDQMELAPKVVLSEPLMRPAEAAALLAVRTSWIYEACRTGRLPHIRVGRHLRFTRAELERWLDTQRVGGH